jgi:hypothetical protein
MAIILMAFGLRFVLPLFVAILIFSGITSTLYANWVGFHINYIKFSNYYILYCCGFVAQINFELGFSLTPFLSRNALCRWRTQMSETV